MTAPNKTTNCQPCSIDQQPLINTGHILWPRDLSLSAELASLEPRNLFNAHWGKKKTKMADGPFVMMDIFALRDGGLWVWI